MNGRTFSHPNVMDALRMRYKTKNSKASPGIKRVWFVSENPADRHLLQVAVEEIGMDIEFLFLKNEVELNRQLQKSTELPPDMVFLDYFMARLSGLDLLKTIRKHPVHNQLITIMMVPAMFEKIVWASYEEGTNCCILMPVDYYDLIKTLRGVLGYWSNMLQSTAR